MAKVEFLIRNEAGKEEIRRSKELTTRDYRDYLAMNVQLESGGLNQVEELDVQLAFLANLFDDVTVEELLEYTDYRQIFEIFVKVHEHLMGSPSTEGKD